MKAQNAQKERGKDNVYCKESSHEDGREIELRLRMRNLFLRVPEECVPLQGQQLPVRLPDIRL